MLVPNWRCTPSEACQLYGTCAFWSISCDEIAGRKHPGALFVARQVCACTCAKLGTDCPYGTPGLLNGLAAKSARPSLLICGCSWCCHAFAQNDGWSGTSPKNLPTPPRITVLLSTV